MSRFSADEIRKQAEEWKESNPQPWNWLVRKARIATEQGKKFSVHDLFSALRWSDFAIYSNDQFKINHNLESALVRLLLIEIPEAKNFVTLRPSKCDKAFKEVFNG